MDPRNATPDEEFLPGQEFRDEKGRGFADFVTASGLPGELAQRWHVRRLASTGSTNEDLVLAGQRGAPDRLVLVADHQTAGRGRLDRRWEAPPGVNLLVSILFRVVPDRPHQLTQAVALSALEACERVASVANRSIDASLKWPNDIVVGTRKLAGILATASVQRRSPSVENAASDVPDHVVVGLGLNVRWAPEDAVCLAQILGDVHRDDVLVSLVAALDGLLALGAQDVHRRYAEALSTIGCDVRVEMPSGESIRGRALGVDLDGRLEVLDSCAMTHRIDVADIVHLRPS